MMNCSDGGTPKTYLANLAGNASLEPNSNLSGPAAQVNILEAKNRLSQLIKSAQSGEEVVIANRGEPVARLVATRATTATATGVGSAAAFLAWLTDKPLPAHLRRSQHSRAARGLGLNLG